jgi:hypothetical protein
MRFGGVFPANTQVFDRYSFSDKYLSDMGQRRLSLAKRKRFLSVAEVKIG